MESKSRIIVLDSLRGLAAGTVVVAHVLGVLLEGHTFDEYTPLYLVRAAHESVIFFFLLSGFVLSYQIENQGYFSYRKFLILRFFRLYVPYFVVMFFIVALLTLTKVGNHLSPDLVLDHLLLIGNFDSNYWNPVIWSLVHEMRVSIMFPILLAIVSLNYKKALSIALMLSFLAAIAITFQFDESEGYNNSYTYTLHYFSVFIVGGLIAKHCNTLTNWHFMLSERARMTLLISALLIFNYSRMFQRVPHKFKFYKIAQLGEFVADWATTLAAAVFIIAAINITSNKNVLSRPFPLFLGKISYSLYLIHFPVIFIGLKLFSEQNKVLVVSISVVIGMLLAYLSNRYVEKPARSLGKWVGDRKFRFNSERLMH